MRMIRTLLRGNPNLPNASPATKTRLYLISDFARSQVREIETLDYLPRDITIPVGKMRDASFDVHCKLHDGSRIVIEMQNYVKQAFLDRSTIYTAAAILEHYVNCRTNGYYIVKTIFIAITGDPIFKTVERTPVRVSLCDIDEERTTVRNDKVLQIYVELPKFAGSLDEIDEETPFVEKLAYVLMEMADCKDIPTNLGYPLLESLFKAADKEAMKPEEKENYMKSILGEAEYEANLYDWKKEGLEEGKAEGRVLGMAEGRAEGRAEGIAESKKETARKLLLAGVDVSVISQCTGLKVEEIIDLDS